MTLTAAFGATDGTLTAAFDGALVNVAVAEATAPDVMIVPRELALSFTTSEGKTLLDAARVLAGGATEVRVALNNAGELLENEKVQVSLTAMTVTIDLPALTLTARVPSTMFIHWRGA